ncbi:MAG: hypothetical protein HWE20_03685 [Gammaproteobacteria bacterium]|nr:hypothetical protein [Gammaproteobacteria bacterium]
MNKKINICFIIAVFACFLIITLKIYSIEQIGVQPYPLGAVFDSDSFEGFIVRDELTYINWIQVRSNALLMILQLQRDATNLFGYFVAGLVEFSGYWWFGYFSGLFGLYAFYKSSISLFNHLDGEGRGDKKWIIFFMLSPGVLMLGSSMLRDLWVLVLLNLLIISAIKRRILLISLLIIIMFFLRNFYVPLLMPILLYFTIRDNFFRKFASLLGSFLVIVSVLVLINLKPALYQTDLTEIFLRMMSGVFGISIELIRFFKNFENDKSVVLEYLGLVFHFLVASAFWVYIIKNIKKVSVFSVLVLSFAISLSIMYGYFLGYFVVRTKLIIIWLMVLAMVHSSGNRSYVRK